MPYEVARMLFIKLRFALLNSFWIRKLSVYMLKYIYKLIFSPVLVKENTYHFQSFNGDFICDSPWFLYEELDRRVSGNFVWVVNNISELNMCRFREKRNVRFVKFGTIHYYISLARASVIFSNSRLPYFFSKKKSQIYIQTWHGTPLKKIGLDIGCSTNDFTSYRAIDLAYRVERDNIDIFVSPSPYASDKFCTSFAIDKGKILEFGYPRNDILVKKCHDLNYITKIKVNLGIPINSKVILYAPTYRDNSVDNNGVYHASNLLDSPGFIRNFPEDVIFLFRGHYFSKVGINKDRFIDVSYVNEIAELYLISDVLITDYSSVFFDFALLNKPIYFYMPDFFEYKNKVRGFYLKIPDFLPGMVVHNEEVLAEKILNDNFEMCEHKYFNEIYNPYEDGNSSARYINYILNVNSGS